MESFKRIFAAGAALFAAHAAETAHAQTTPQQQPSVAAQSEATPPASVQRLILRPEAPLRDDTAPVLPVEPLRERADNGPLGFDGGVTYDIGNGRQVEIGGDGGDVRLGVRQEF